MCMYRLCARIQYTRSSGYHALLNEVNRGAECARRACRQRSDHIVRRCTKISAYNN